MAACLARRISAASTPTTLSRCTSTTAVMICITPPLPSGGLTSLSILKTLEQFDLSQLSPWGTRCIELFAGASNLAWRERFEYFGDPDFVKVPVEELLSEKRAIARAELIRKGIPAAPPQPSEPSHTVNIVVIDKDQNLVSWTATHGGGFGSHVAIEGLGLMLGHGMSRFAFNSPDPNFPVGGKRPQHNMSPLIVLHRGKPFAALGLPGGRVIVDFTAQMAVSLIDFKDTHRISFPPRGFIPKVPNQSNSRNSRRGRRRAS